MVYSETARCQHEIRIECLRLASEHSGTIEGTVDRARKYANFVFDEEATIGPAEPE